MFRLVLVKNFHARHNSCLCCQPCEKALKLSLFFLSDGSGG
uniref:Uncharacterized protein n=1 Tax=Arundo donax TaxID=35708 RepID=A0A0A8Z2N5_ARUDO